MKRTHKIILTVLSFLLLAGPVVLLAQPNPPRMDRQALQRLIEDGKEELGITDEQEEQLLALQEEARATMQELRTGDYTQTERQDAMRQLGADMRASIMEILTPEQIEQIQTGREERQANRMAQIEAKKEALGLTEEQETQLTALAAETKEQLQTIRETDYESPEDRRAAVQQVYQEQSAAIDEILTPEQVEMLKENRDKRRQRSRRRGQGRN